MDDSKENPDVPRRSSRLMERATISRSRPDATLLGVPTEIRLMIYGHLSPVVSSSQSIFDACHRDPSEECALRRSQPEKKHRGYLSLLLTCHKIYDEAVEVLYKPIIRPDAEQCAVPRIRVSDERIVLGGFPGLFCRTHLVYRNVAVGVLRRIDCLHVEITSTLEYGASCVCCGDWHPADEDGCVPLFGFDDKSQSIDNVRWLAEQLRHSGSFKHLKITVDWDPCCEDPPELDDLESLLKPLKALRNVEDMRISELGTILESLGDDGELYPEMIEFWENEVAYKMKMRQILGSNAPVPENPIPISTWLGFKQTVRRIMTFAPQVGAAKYLRKVAVAFDKQDKSAFQKNANDLFKAWKEDKKQRQKIDLKFSEIRHAELFDIPAGKRQEDDPEGMKFSSLNWSNPEIDMKDRATYIAYLQSIDC